MTACGPTWHRLTDPDGEPLWFRLGTRIRDANGTYVYRFGPEPDDARCRTIWCSDGKSWTCAACGETISAERYGSAPPKRAPHGEAFRIPVPISGPSANSRHRGTEGDGASRPDGDDG